MSASASPSVDCNSANAVGYKPGSPEDLYRAPPGCPSGIDKIPSVYSSISAASAVGGAAVPSESLVPSGGSSVEGGPETYWECTDPENPPDWAKGPDGRVTMRPVGCPSRVTVAPGEGDTQTAVPNEATVKDPMHRTGTSTFIEATGSKQTAVPNDATVKDPLHRTGTSTYIEATGSKGSAVPNEATVKDPLHRTGTSTYPEAAAVTSQVAAPSADAQKEEEKEKDQNTAGARKVGVAGLLAAVALAVVNF